jgi:hypothetical protein
MPTPTPKIDYRKAAIDKFTALKICYDKPLDQNGATYWRLGNSFDSIIDFLALIDNSQANDVATMVKKQYDASLSALGGYDAAWFDDFGWWTIAAQRATKQSFFSQQAQKDFKDIVQNCWTRFTENAPFVWERHPKTYDAYRPAVADGVWNGYWIGTDKKWKGPKSGNPSNGGLEGIQNTVTNCVYWIAAQRLAANDPKTKEAAKREFTFLDAWFTKESPALFWYQPLGGAILVRERVSHFFGDKDNAPGFQENWAWTGDQGLVLRGLVDRILLIGVSPDDRVRLIDYAKKIIDGAMQSLVDAGSVLQAYTKKSGIVPDNDTKDYDTGPAVFWRNLLYVWTALPELKAHINQPQCQQVLRASAQAAVNANAQTFNELTNDLSVLVAASQILK